MPAGYNYDAKLRIASAGLSPASTAASLAAPVRRVFPSTASSIRHLPVWIGAFRRHGRVKADPAIPLNNTHVCSSDDALYHEELSPLCATPTASTPSPEPRGPRSGWVMLSHPSTLDDLIRQSGDLLFIYRIPGYRIGLWHSWVILPDLHTFRTFTAVLSRIAAFSLRREPRYVRLSSSVSTLAIG